MKKLTKDLFESFTAIGEDPRDLHRIALQEGWVYATNGHIVLGAKKEHVDFDTEETESYPKVHELVQKHLETDYEPHHVEISELNGVLYQLEKEPIYKTFPCKECDGDGVQYCACCDNESDCKNCGGSGELVTDQEIGTTYRAYDQLQIADRQFRAKYVDLIARTAQTLGLSELEWRHKKSDNPHSAAAIIPVGDAFIIVMPCLPHNAEFEQHTHEVQLMVPGNK